MLTEMFLYRFIMSLLIKKDLSLDVGSPERVGEIWDVSPSP